MAQDAVDFEQSIRPILRTRCVECHGANKHKSGLRLDAKSFALKGGHGGAAIVPGKSLESELIRRVTSAVVDERMPPGDMPLSREQIELLKRWIDGGANWPETDTDREAARDRRLDHWAWQPIVVDRSAIKRPDCEAITDDLRNEIDFFVVAKLCEKGLALSPEADRRTLIRRLAFDLLGLPPTPEDVREFVNDHDPRAYERLVDRILNSPRYGERWARHWLDIAHYADTHGFERDKIREHAWRYRDWVIRAFNADMPYDQFLRDQIAGDALRPGDPDAVIATGFLAAGPWDFVGQAETPSPVLKRLARADDLDDIVAQVMTAACGVTVHCARCHDHKLDPISQREYYALWSVFAGVKRADRIVSIAEQNQLADRRAELERNLRAANAELAKLRETGWSLSDIVGGGDGLGTGKPKVGIDPISGKPQSDNRGFLENAKPNQFAKASVRFVDGVVIPGGGEVPISSTGLVARKVPTTGGKAWDAIRNGPVNSQFSTKLGGIDFAAEGHSLLALHANAAITFDLAELRKSGLPETIRLRASAGYFGQTPKSGASVHVWLDGELKLERLGLGRDDGLIDVDVSIPSTARFLTLMATDGGNDISHDQICFADARLEIAKPISPAPNETEFVAAMERRNRLQRELAALPEPAKVYGIVGETPPPVHLLARGDPEQPQEAVLPGALRCMPGASASFGGNELTDSQRRIALANWITDRANPLTRRVMVNRLWHHHFGSGLVDTPSDFGLGGNLPSHPELLDWLAEEFLGPVSDVPLDERHVEKAPYGSLKQLHRLIVTSATYRQTSTIRPTVDSSNRLLWRQNPRRLDAESVRDAVLAVSGKLNRAMYGPGYRDFDYKEEYAPVYTYVTPDKSNLWRRSIYRFVVRTTPHQFLTTLDCPNPANLTPTRNVTTTALQSLALLNDEFVLKQASYFATRVEAEAGASVEAQITRAFELAFGRSPTSIELDAARPLVAQRGLPTFCRFLLNANEFVYVD